MFASLFAGGDTVDPNSLPADFATDLEVVKESVENYYSNEKRQIFTTTSQIARAFATLVTAALGVVTILLIQLEDGSGVNRYMLIAEAVVQILGLQTVLSAFDAGESTERAKIVAKYVLGIVLMVAGVALPAFASYYYLKRIAIVPVIFVSVALLYVFITLMKARKIGRAHV